MKVSSYESSAKKLLYVLVPVGSDLDVTLPSDVKASLGALTLSKEFELDPAQPRVGLDLVEAIQHIQANGYYLNQAKITITTRSGGNTGPIISQREIP
ncbi:YcgL domain-containing protein [Xanthomonas hortorum]|uniref:YcgL domain-containing protein n=1 Tax=Xanthomonas hortorum TaxID=56454 RepID=UPI001300C373|nr:YcgL domain-containing protein [Xanthomonas hortorum]MCC8497078.1 YcgL domain-containing protein [Xanthomonas hortorum pv. gardneri]MCC8506331.1 YcgL domain-containing protein [Xanthomonas hortorum pv. gardneri]MCC8512940.1 YcgL domain-containing protein [Xanthomonas hortorum pv. gardneri]MCC8520718.1 YcgL domain-containing protein [Xanthomonas hortorum pv. gardneri]MCC8522920.1 YcgL domain-containing protein [Xanthomonas hortorum pv. gardneri]